VIEVPIISLFLLALASFILGLFAADVFCKMLARRFNWRILYDRGCEKCGKVSDVFINTEAECINCIHIESDRRMAEFQAEQKRLEEDLAVELKRIADESDAERVAMEGKFAAEQAARDKAYAEETERIKKSWEEADKRIQGDE
jgi:sporulation protein YlmC with PRC-barrel domain